MGDAQGVPEGREMVLVMRFFLSIRGGLDHFIAPFCRSTNCFGPAWKFHKPLEFPS